MRFATTFAIGIMLALGLMANKCDVNVGGGGESSTPPVTQR